MSSYSAFCLSLPVLLLVLLALCLVRGGAATISNTIHKNLVFSVFMSEVLYFIALKGRSSLVANEVMIINLLFNPLDANQRYIIDCCLFKNCQGYCQLSRIRLLVKICLNMYDI